MITDEDNNVVYFRTEGPTALANREKELIGHGTLMHTKGYCSPIGRLKGINLPIEKMSPTDLSAYDIFEGQRINLSFEGDIELSGEVVTGKRNVKGKILLIHFQNCMITYREEVLYSPEQGDFFLAIGKKVTSAYAGPADLDSFDLIDHKISDVSQVEKSENELEKENLYQVVRQIRESDTGLHKLEGVLSDVRKNYSSEWLLLLEIYELTYERHDLLAEQALSLLEGIKNNNSDLTGLITAGLGLLDQKMTKVH